MPEGPSAKFLKIRVSFAAKVPRGIITLYWKYMLKCFPPDQLRPFATLIDEILSRTKVDVHLDSAAKAGTFDEINVDDPRLDGTNFGRFLEGVGSLIDTLTRR